KLAQIADKFQTDVLQSSITVLGHYEFSLSLGSGACLIVPLVYFVRFRSIDKGYDIGILFNGTRFPTIREDGTLAPPTGLHGPGQLGQVDYRYVQFLGQCLEVSRYGADLLLPVPSFLASAGGHQLQIIDDDQFDPVLGSQSSGLGP